MTKLCRLISEWPTGTIRVQARLEKQQIYKQLSNKYAASGWLIKIGSGAYIRAGEKATWQGGVYALQKDLGLGVHVGGLSALELLGRSHFVPMGKYVRLYIYAHNKHLPRYLPKWFRDLENLTIRFVSKELFTSNIGLMDFDCGSFTIQISEPERAIFEILSLVPRKISFEHACLLMQYQDNLRHDVIDELLKDCKSQVVKRLFLYLARKFSLSVMHKINLDNLDLGRGMRVIGQGEVFDEDLNLYLPRISADIDPDQEVPDV